MAGTAAVNLLWCVPGDVGGSEEYLVRQLLGLVELGVEAERRPTLYCLRSFAAAHPELVAEFTTRTLPISGRPRPLRIAAEHTWLARATSSASLVHHGGGTVPALGRRPVVLTIHDLQYLALPEHFSRPKLDYLRLTMPRSARRAEVVTVPSAFVAETVAEAFGVDDERIVVVPHPVPRTLGASPTPEQELRRRFGLGQHPVVAYPAITHPHKNHRFLVDLLASGTVDPDLRLVLIGGSGAADADVRAAVERSGVGARVVRTGRVSDADRDGLISLAQALVFPSGYEGFGAPAIEAMALGTPVVASDRGALPEVVGGAGLVVPLDIEAWAAALSEVRRHRGELVSAGRARLAEFTPQRAATALWRAYDLAIESSP